MKDFDFITKQATDIGNNWTNREIILFHAFNPNGLIAEKHKIGDEIYNLINQGLMKPGAALAYNCDYSYRTIMDDLINKNRPRTIKMQTALDNLRRDIDRAKIAITEAKNNQ